MPVIIAAHAAAPQIHLVILRYGPVRAGVPFGCWPRQERCAEEAGGQPSDVIHVADNLQIAATRGAEKLESKSSYAELNNFKKRTDLPTGRDEFRVGHYKTERTRQGIVNIKFLLEELVRFAWLIDAERDLIGDSDAVTFQSYYFLRVIRQNTDVFQAQVDQDLRAYAAFMLDQTLARG